MRNIVKYFITLVILLIGTIVYSQNLSLKDSFDIKYKAMPDDTNKLKLIFSEAKKYSFADIDKSSFLAHESIKLSQKINNNYTYADALNLLGILQYQLGNFDSSETLYLRSLELSQKYNYSPLINKTNGNIGLLYSNTGKYDKAVEYLIKSIKANEANNNRQSMARNYADLAGVYFRWNKLGLCQKYNLKALELFRETGSLSGEANVLNTMGTAAESLGDTVKALEYLYASLRIKEKLEDKNGMATTYHNIGEIYSSQNKLDSGYLYTKRALDINTELENINGMSTNLISLGYILNQQGDYEQSLLYHQKAYEIAVGIGSGTLAQTASYNLSECYRKLGKFKEAFEFYKISKNYSDSMVNVQVAEKMAEVETRYQTEKKDKEIRIKTLEIDKQKQNIKNLFIVSVLILIFVVTVSVLLYNRFRLKQRTILQKELNLQQKRQFQAVIEAEEKERKRIAQELHDGLGQLLSTAKMNVASLDDAVSTSDDEDKAVFNNSLGLIDEAVSEVRNISHNLMPGALIKLGLIPALNELVKKINTAGTINIDFDYTGKFDSLPEASEIAIYRIVQEVLNNSIKHSKAKSIRIEFIQDNEKLNLNISDDGKGMDVSKISESRGIGWKNIYSRVSMLNGSIEIKSSAGEGTNVEIVI